MNARMSCTKVLLGLSFLKLQNLYTQKFTKKDGITPTIDDVTTPT